MMREHVAFSRVDHRPWPLPQRPWVGQQIWQDLLFAHWALPREIVAPFIPPPLALDTFEDQAYISVTPFRMEGFAVRPLPPPPGLSSFLELNLRTYVTYQGKPGIWFFSLDASSFWAVLGARITLNLPYHHAKMSIESAKADANDPRFSFESRRTNRRARFAATYGPAGPVFEAAPGSLEHFLCERYCLYGCTHKGTPYRLQIHHRPWPLQPAETVIESNLLTAPMGLSIGDTPTSLQYAERLDVVVYPPERL